MLDRADPPSKQLTMFSLPKIGGKETLGQLVHAAGGNERVCRDLHIAPELLTAYLSGELDPPYAFMVAVWFTGPYGFAQGFRESHWTHQYNWGRREEAERRVAAYRAFLQAVAAVGALDADTCMALADQHGIEDAWAALPGGMGGVPPMATVLRGTRKTHRLPRGPVPSA